MMGKVVAFPGCRVPDHPTPLPNLPEPFTAAWQREHLPLVDKAMELLQADEAELQRRCRAMAKRDGRTFLADLAAQIDRLSSHIGDVAIALSLAALRIRRATAALPA